MPQKINQKVKEVTSAIKSGKVRLMFEDEAGFGRINKPKACWCAKGKRPTVPCHHIREYRYAFGADVITNLCNTMNMLTNDMVKHIALREWIEKCFLELE